jgi:ribosomal protein S12 methylthiotransferase
VLPYLDIPVQHISTNVLRAMRRAGSGDQVRRLIGRLREEVPGLTLRTTLLLGFPGEREEDVAELEAFVREAGIGRLGAFVYSPEEGTSGFELEGRVAPEEMEQRRARVLAARDEVLRSAQAALVGSEIEVLVDTAQAEGDAGAVARAAMDAPEVDLVAHVLDCRASVGERLRVRVRGLDAESNLVCAPLERADPDGRGR